MILTDKNNTRIVIRCDCGTESIGIGKLFDGEEPLEYYMDISIYAFSTEQEGFFSKLKNRLKTIWYILRHGTHRFQEIILTEEDMKDLKEVINRF